MTPEERAKDALALAIRDAVEEAQKTVSDAAWQFANEKLSELQLMREDPELSSSHFHFDGQEVAYNHMMNFMNQWRSKP